MVIYAPMVVLFTVLGGLIMCNIIELEMLGLSNTQNRELMLAAISLMNERYVRELEELALPDVEEIEFTDAVMALFGEAA